jgi:CCR4-NOT transcription complex subunit 9
MEQGTELSKTVATFILQKILLDDTGLSYICQTYERFSHVAVILVSLITSINLNWWSCVVQGKMVIQLAKEPSQRLLKHVVRCYSRLSDNPRCFWTLFDLRIFANCDCFRALQALRQCLPDQLKDQTFQACLADDRSTQHWLSQLMTNLSEAANNPSAQGMAMRWIMSQSPLAFVTCSF